jgi:PAS domain S-box-containing protein
MLNNLFLGANITISACYFVIGCLIFQRLLHPEQNSGKNPLAVATLAMFLSCSFGHLAHGLMIGLAEKYSQIPLMLVQVGFDLVTAIVAISYLALQRQYNILIELPLLLEQTQNQLAEADEQLSKINPNLESLVAERTEELCQINQQLNQANNIKDELLLSEKTLREQLTNILESISDAFFALDNEWKFTYINHQGEKLLGKTQAEILGENLWELFPEAVNTTFYDQYHRAIRENITIQFEEFYLPLNLWLEVRVYPAVNGLSVYMQDITKRKQTEAAQRQSEEQYRTLAQNFPNGAVLLFDENLRFTLAEGAELAPAGIPKQFLEGKTIWEVFGEETSKLIEPNYRAALAGYSCVQEVPFAGNIYLSHMIPLKNEAGKIVGGMVMTQNINEHKRNEQALKQSQERLKLALESAKMCYWDWDLHTDTFTVSENHDRVCGSSLDANKGGYAAFMERVHPEDRNRINKALSATIEDRASYDVEFRTLLPDDSIHWIASKGQVIYGDEGKPARIIGTAMDISDRKRDEEALRKSEERLWLLVENMPVMMNAVNEQGVFIAWNRECERVTGYSAAEIVGNPKAIEILYPDPEYRAAMFAAWEERGNDYRDWEWQTTCRDGSIKTTSWSNISARFPIPGWAAWGIGVDITKRTQAEQKLRNALQKLDFHVENTPLGVVEWDKDFCLQRWSKQAETIFGWQAQEVIGKSFLDWQFVYEEDVPQVNAIAAALVDGSSPMNICSNRNYTKDGRIIYSEWYNSALLDDTGNLVSILCLVQDITARKRAEQEILELNQDLERRVVERTAQLQATNKELEAFCYSVSHDLRAPLRSIDGFSLALLERYQSQLDDKGKHYLQRVRAASQRMSELIDDLLELSRVTRGEMHLSAVDLSAMVEEIAVELQQTQPKRTVEFIIAPDGLVEGDGRLLRVALENLLHNAWKFTSNKPQARIEFGILGLETVSLSAQPKQYFDFQEPNQVNPHPQCQTVYFVRDNGAGFDMNYATKLFGAFQRLHTQDEFPGTGIGLATVQRIINRHAGYIWAEGVVEQGATFYFCLPQR